MIVNGKYNSLRTALACPLKPAALDPNKASAEVKETPSAQGDSCSLSERPADSKPEDSKSPASPEGLAPQVKANNSDLLLEDGDRLEGGSGSAQEPSERSPYDLDAVPVDGDGFGAGGGYNKIQESTEKTPNSINLDPIDGDGFGAGGGYFTIQGGAACLLTMEDFSALGQGWTTSGKSAVSYSWLDSQPILVDGVLSLSGKSESKPELKPESSSQGKAK